MGRRRLHKIATSDWPPQNRQATDAWRSQHERVTGEANIWVLEDSFLANLHRP